MGNLCYLTGPVRSGKSAEAVRLATAWGPGAVFVATYRPDPSDEEMLGRIRRHQAERPGWRTLECVPDVAEGLAQLSPPPSGVLMDCLTLWASDRFHLSDEEILGQWDGQLARFKAFPWPMIIVGNEIGWAPVPANAELRRFRDLVGWLAQRTAAAADEAALLVAGCRVRFK